MGTKRECCAAVPSVGDKVSGLTSSAAALQAKMLY